MVVFFSWLILSFIFAIVGASRRIGFFFSFLACLFLSPLIGLLIILSSTSNSTQRVLNQQSQSIENQQKLTEYNNYVKIRSENPQIYTFPSLSSNQHYVKMVSSIIPNDAIGKPLVFKKHHIEDGQKVKAGERIIQLAYGEKVFSIRGNIEDRKVKVKHVLKPGEFVLEGDVLYIIEEI